MDERFSAGRDFLMRYGRLVERRLFAACFEGAPPSGVLAAVAAYRNEDGGFGHGLEPDKRCPASLPIDVETALQSMAAVGAADPEVLAGVCGYLARVAQDAGSGGAVPLAFPVIEAYPRAAHWTDWTYAPALNPTAGLVGLLYQLGADHPWIAEAAAWCWSRINSGDLPDDAHALSEVLVLLAHAPERDLADAAAAVVRVRLENTAMFLLDPEATGYGLTPLNIAPLADSRWRGLFDEALIEAHLDRLVREQQADGGWPISWEPPGEAALLEWRGIVTLQALRTLASYGRLDASA